MAHTAATAARGSWACGGGEQRKVLLWQGTARPTSVRTARLQSAPPAQSTAWHHQPVAQAPAQVRGWGQRPPGIWARHPRLARRGGLPAGPPLITSQIAPEAQPSVQGVQHTHTYTHTHDHSHEDIIVAAFTADEREDGGGTADASAQLHRRVQQRQAGSRFSRQAGRQAVLQAPRQCTPASPPPRACGAQQNLACALGLSRPWLASPSACPAPCSTWLFCVSQQMPQSWTFQIMGMPSCRRLRTAARPGALALAGNVQENWDKPYHRPRGKPADSGSQG